MTGERRPQSRTLQIELEIDSDGDLEALEGALLAARAAELAELRRRGDRLSFGYGTESARESMSDEVADRRRRWTMLDRLIGALDRARATSVIAIRRAATDDLSSAEVEVLKRLFEAAWRADDGTFGEEDWEHAKGGVHVLVEDGSEIASHGAVVERTLELRGVPVRTGYVEAVATWPEQQHRGFGTLVMRELGDVVGANYPLGALSTGVPEFYERLGWERWRGPTSVRTPRGVQRTPDDDDGIMILRTPTSPPLNLDDPIVCDWRDGDVW
jgi:aminoglycoside 2'-N-acetyltransferase I